MSKKFNRALNFAIGLLVLCSITLMPCMVGAETSNRKNIENQEYFEDFEGISSLSEIGYVSTTNKDDTTTYRFLLGSTDKNGNGLEVNTNIDGLGISAPSKNYGFKVDAASFENGDKSLEVSYDLYIPSGVTSDAQVPGYITVNDANYATKQCIAAMPQAKIVGTTAKFLILDAEVDTGTQWAANVATKTLYADTSGAMGRWVNLKMNVSYIKESGVGYYVTYYMIDGERVYDSNGTLATAKIREAVDPTQKSYIQFMIYGYNGPGATEKFILDNLSMKLVDEKAVVKSNLKNGVLTYTYNNGTSKDVDYTMLFASYNSDGTLKEVYTASEGVMAKNTSGNITESILSLTEGENYKVFLLDSTDNIKPLSNVCDLEVPSMFKSAQWITAPNVYSASDNKYVKGASDNAMYRADSVTLWDDTKGQSPGAYESNEFVALKMAAAPLLRTTFDTGDKTVKSATAKVTGLGYYEVYLNGEKIGDKVLEPFTTLYDKDCVYYSEYDVTNMIKSGKNGVGAVLGRGTYNVSGDGALGMSAVKRGSVNIGKQRLKMSILIEYTDGTIENIPTDTTWKASRSPIRYDQNAYGEFYDARMEDSLSWEDNGWTKGDFDDTSWASAELEESKDPKGELVKAPLNYNKVVNTYDNLSVTDMGNNTFRVDVGRVLTGWAGLKNLTGTDGEQISLHYIENPETWDSNGSDHQSNKTATFYYKDKDGAEQNVTTYAQTDYYIMKSGVNNWSPRFTLKSFRYVDITFPSRMSVSAEQVKAMVYVEEVHANVEETGTFTSSNEIFNKTHDLAKNTLLNNMHSYISDTPLHENAPYLIDGVASSEWGIYNFDMENYLRKWLRDIRATQDGKDAEKPGRLNAIAPVYSINNNAGPEWSEGFAELTWALYQNTGKKDILEENYDNLKLLLEWETSSARKLEAESITAAGKLVNGTLPDYVYTSLWGDHVPPSQLSGYPAKRFFSLTATAFVYREAVLLSDMAKTLGKTSDAAKFTALANNIKNAFNENFWDESKGYYHDAKVYKTTSGGTDEFRQTPQIIAIKFGLADETKKAALLEKLKENIDMLQEEGYSGFSTGVIGNKYIFDVLTENGMVDELYEIFNTEKYPGYGYWIKNGATSMWEYWEVGQRSDNHHMFGSIDKWFYRYLAGITEAEPGYKKTNIKPYIPTGMTSASGSIETSFGKISSSWTVEESGKITLSVTVPQGVTATVYVPIKENMTVTAPTGATEVTSDDAGYKAYTVGSGTFEFIAE